MIVVRLLPISFPLLARKSFGIVIFQLELGRFCLETLLDLPNGLGRGEILRQRAADAADGLADFLADLMMRIDRRPFWAIR